MEKHKNSTVWAEAGYDLFAHDGMDGIQIERLARILQLNKSGFYHYFGDLEGFYVELLKLHKQKINLFVAEACELKTLDPDYLNLVVRHASLIMFQVQLVRNPNNLFFYNASEMFDEKLGGAVRQLWCDYLDVPGDSDLGIRYLAIVRDMFYTRVGFQTLTYTFLHNIVASAKAIMDEISQLQSV